ncbi:Kinesin motor domain containing protein [Reticulomyxa filosa]|uniref:Kinesin motor domain containing protein n=1 Tax=Reticulomyxa filosa TaxID=46433 RepID=X6NW20_RETFI|nr:Kinesin motor domain containing protein [Reticulomyxa filosa]|eukprot:ETO30495.1 Kinesin motor domain containing protein [Reticulomyxa filosa]
MKEIEEREKMIKEMTEETQQKDKEHERQIQEHLKQQENYQHEMLQMQSTIRDSFQPLNGTGGNEKRSTDFTSNSKLFQPSIVSIERESNGKANKAESRGQSSSLGVPYQEQHALAEQLVEAKERITKLEAELLQYKSDIYSSPVVKSLKEQKKKLEERIIAIRSEKAKIIPQFMLDKEIYLQEIAALRRQLHNAHCINKWKVLLFRKKIDDLRNDLGRANRRMEQAHYNKGALQSQMSNVRQIAEERLNQLDNEYFDEHQDSRFEDPHGWTLAVQEKDLHTLPANLQKIIEDLTIRLMAKHNEVIRLRAQLQKRSNLASLEVIQNTRSDAPVNDSLFENMALETAATVRAFIPLIQAKTEEARASQDAEEEHEQEYEDGEESEKKTKDNELNTQTSFPQIPSPAVVRNDNLKKKQLWSDGDVSAFSPVPPMSPISDIKSPNSIKSPLNTDIDIGVQAEYLTKMASLSAEKSDGVETKIVKEVSKKSRGTGVSRLMEAFSDTDSDNEKEEEKDQTDSKEKSLSVKKTQNDASASMPAHDQPDNPTASKNAPKSRVSINPRTSVKTQVPLTKFGCLFFLNNRKNSRVSIHAAMSIWEIMKEIRDVMPLPEQLSELEGKLVIQHSGRDVFVFHFTFDIAEMDRVSISTDDFDKSLWELFITHSIFQLLHFNVVYADTLNEQDQETQDIKKREKKPSWFPKLFQPKT